MENFIEIECCVGAMDKMNIEMEFLSYVGAIKLQKKLKLKNDDIFYISFTFSNKKKKTEGNFSMEHCIVKKGVRQYKRKLDLCVQFGTNHVQTNWSLFSFFFLLAIE